MSVFPPLAHIGLARLKSSVAQALEHEGNRDATGTEVLAKGAESASEGAEDGAADEREGAGRAGFGLQHRRQRTCGVRKRIIRKAANPSPATSFARNCFMQDVLRTKSHQRARDLKESRTGTAGAAPSAIAAAPAQQGVKDETRQVAMHVMESFEMRMSRARRCD